MIFRGELETSQRSRECQCCTTSISRNHLQAKPHNLHQSSSLQKQPGFIQRAQESIRSFQAFKHSLQKRQIVLGSWQYSLELEDEKLDDEGCVSPFKTIALAQQRDRRFTKKSTTMFDRRNYNELYKKMRSCWGTRWDSLLPKRCPTFPLVKAFNMQIKISISCESFHLPKQMSEVLVEPFCRTAGQSEVPENHLSCEQTKNISLRLCNRIYLIRL